MKKLIIKIGNEKHELPYNGEAVSFEVSEKYVPKVGDCVKARGDVLGCASFFKIVSIDYSGNIKAKHCVDLHKGKCTIDLDYFWFSSETNFTQITPEELKAKYAEAGYEWDYETNEVNELKWMPKEGDTIWYLDLLLKPAKYEFDNDTKLKMMLERNLLFPTEEKCKEFSEHCLSFLKK